MATPLSYLQCRTSDNWLVGVDGRAFRERCDRRMQELRNRPHDRPLTVLIADRDPVEFLACFIAACATDCQIFLANPDWVKSEWDQVFDRIDPDRCYGHFPVPKTQPSTLNSHPSTLIPYPLICIPTGGSSGKLRFVMHTWETLMAAVQGFQRYFEVRHINSYCVLPLYHVSGLMQFLRSFTSGGRLVVQPFKAIADNPIAIDPAEFFISLVPTQLDRLLNSSLLPPPSSLLLHPSLPPPPWLAQFQTVLLGGGPAWPELLHQARQEQIRLAPTYGMTETAGQIATLKPDDFLAGRSGCGQVLPHAQVTIATLAPAPGAIGLRAASLAIGYYPTPFPTRDFQPDDLGFFDDRGSLHLVGRASDKIITGGENVFPAEVEAAIRATGLVQDVCVFGVSDRHWGQCIMAAYVPTPNGAIARLQAALEPKLSRFKHPKHWVALEQLPRNAQGKLNRDALIALVKDEG